MGDPVGGPENLEGLPRMVDPTAMDAFEAGARRPRICRCSNGDLPTRLPCDGWCQEDRPHLVPFTNQDGTRLIEFTSAEWDAYWHGVEAEAAILLSRLRDE